MQRGGKYTSLSSQRRADPIVRPYRQLCGAQSYFQAKERAKAGGKAPGATVEGRGELERSRNPDVVRAQRSKRGLLPGGPSAGEVQRRP